MEGGGCDGPAGGRATGGGTTRDRTTGEVTGDSALGVFRRFEVAHFYFFFLGSHTISVSLFCWLLLLVGLGVVVGSIVGVLSGGRAGLPGGAGGVGVTRWVDGRAIKVDQFLFGAPDEMLMTSLCRITIEGVNGGQGVGFEEPPEAIVGIVFAHMRCGGE